MRIDFVRVRVLRCGRFPTNTPPSHHTTNARQSSTTRTPAPHHTAHTVESGREQCIETDALTQTRIYTSAASERIANNNRDEANINSTALLCAWTSAESTSARVLSSRTRHKVRPRRDTSSHTGRLAIYFVVARSFRSGSAHRITIVHVFLLLFA